MQACLWMYEWPQKQWLKYSISCHVVCSPGMSALVSALVWECVCVRCMHCGKSWTKLRKKYVFFPLFFSKLTKNTHFEKNWGKYIFFPKFPHDFFPVCVCYVIEFCVLSRAAYKQQKVNILTESDITLGKIMGKLSRRCCEKNAHFEIILETIQIFFPEMFSRFFPVQSQSGVRYLVVCCSAYSPLCHSIYQWVNE